MEPVATVRVLFADTDAMGIVYYANYLRWFEAGRRSRSPRRFDGACLHRRRGQGGPRAPGVPGADRPETDGRRGGIGAMDRNLALEGGRVTEAAALAAGRAMGRGG